MQILAELADLARILGHQVLAPAVGDHLEQRHERRRRGDDDALLERGLDEVGPLGQRGRQELIARQEQHREFRTVLELFPVALLAELAHALLDLHRVAPERDAARFVVLRFDRVQVGVERRLGVDHDVARLGHAHQQIRSQRAAFAATTGLLGEIAVLGQARELDHAAQRDLAPAAAHFRTAQCGGQIARLALQERLHVHQALDLAGDLAGGLAVFAHDALRLLFLLAQRLP